nr:MAG TPA: hypothetical protein [Caudoviricetes sp.]
MWKFFLFILHDIAYFRIVVEDFPHFAHIHKFAPHRSTVINTQFHAYYLRPIAFLLDR